MPFAGDYIYFSLADNIDNGGASSSRSRIEIVLQPMADVQVSTGIHSMREPTHLSTEPMLPYR